MKVVFKWALLTFFVFLFEQFFIIDGTSFNFSFLLIFFFVIYYFFPKEEQKKIAPSELIPVFYFAAIGLIEDLFQGIIGPAIISKVFTGVLLIIIVKQLFFHWTDFFKALIIFTFTIIDETIYSFFMIYFFNYNVHYYVLIKNFLIKGLVNIPIGLIFSWRKP